MTDDRTDDVFRFALRAGDLMVRNGAPSANVTHVLLAVMRAGGFPAASANVTMGQIVISHVPPDGRGAVSLVHNVGATSFDIDVVTATEQVVKDVVTGDCSARDGADRLAEIDGAPPRHRQGVVLLGWGVMAAGFAWLIGGGLATCVVASLTSIVIELVAARMLREELPGFFVHVTAGAAAVAAALLAQTVAPSQSPAIVVTAALVSRLAGAAALGAAQDLLTGWYLTAAARIVELSLNTAGQVVGVVILVGVARRFGSRLAIEEVPHLSVGVVAATAAAVLVSCGFAVASGLRWRRVPAVGYMAAAVYLVFSGMQAMGWGRMVSACTGAIVLGMVTVLVASAVRIPSSGSLAVVLAPLLPGMLVYQGFVAFVLDNGDAKAFFVEAAGVALATGAGAVLGQYLAGQVVGRRNRARLKVLRRTHGDDYAPDPHVGAAEWLSAPIFRRPFLDEPFRDG